MTETLATSQPEARKSRTFGELLTTDLRALPVVIGLAALWFFLQPGQQQGNQQVF